MLPFSSSLAFLLVSTQTAFAQDPVLPESADPLEVNETSVSSRGSAIEPVFVPDFTPGTTSEFALAFMLQERVFSALETYGIRVLSSDRASSLTGATDDCANAPGCPGDSLEKLPVRIALVVNVERRDGQVYATAGIFTRGREDAAATRTVVIPPEREQAFADVLAEMVRDTAAGMPTPLPREVAQAIALITAPKTVPKAASIPAPIAVAAGEPGSFPPIAPVTGAPPPTLAPVTPPDTFESRLARAQLQPRHVYGVERRFMAMKKPPLEWYRRAAPHAGRTIAEIRVGLGIGDVDRAADVNVDLEDDGTQQSEWFQEGPTQGRRLRGGVYLGYAPAAWIDVGITAGLQYGVRSLTTGYTVEGVRKENPGSDAADAAQLMFAPMVRLYPVVVGLVKPYFLGMADIRLFDDYSIVDPEGADFPEPPGGAVLGVGGGAGLLLDPGPVVGFFAEASYVYHTGIRSIPAFQGETPADPPAPSTPAGFTVGLVGGLQFRI